MSNLYIRKWTDETASNEVASMYSFQTKMTDFNNPYAKKSIQEIIVNLTKGATAGVGTLAISYRTKLDSIFNELAFKHFSNTEEGASQSSQMMSFKNLNIKDVYNLQLQFTVYGSYHLGINDINVVYRVYREVSTDKLTGD